MSSDRLARLAEKLKEQSIDAYFGWSESTLSYLHGYHEHAGHRFLTLAFSPEAHVTLICGALSENQARRAGIQDIRPWRDGEDPMEILRELGKELNLRTGVIAVDEDMPAINLLKMQSVFPTALFKDGGPLLSDLRRKKSAEELQYMIEAAVIADKAYDIVKPKIHAGVTERQVETMLFSEMTRMGGNPNFGIVGAGAGGAEPHHATSDDVLQKGDVVILDFGCDVNGYRSDITRTVAIGEASEKAKKVYEIVYAAHMAGREAAKIGAKVGDLDGAARKVIEDAGYGPQFMHRLGHGIGIMGHEEPFIVPNGTVTLEEGDCFSVEPGIYLAGEFGVRIENILAMNAEEGFSLNVEPSPTLEIVGA